MTDPVTVSATPQGFHVMPGERLPLPPREAMSEAQRAAADEIMAGPRKAIFGPFVPLLRCPALMRRIGQTGESLRFDGSLPERIREFTILLVARESSNQFEWQTHVPVALRSGNSQATIDALADGRRPTGLDAEAQTALAFVVELMRRHGVSDATYSDALRTLGEAGVVELTALTGYFTMVCWIMNVARTPGPVGAVTPRLCAFPA
jgi:4-carboxymuconolactone decarboxylase